MNHTFIRLAWGCLAVFVAASLGAQERKRTMDAIRLDVPPTIDGRLDDEAWKQAATSTGFVDRDLGSEVADQTTVWLGYDDEAIYVAFLCRDARPREIFAVETRPDSDISNEDNVSFAVFPFGLDQGFRRNRFRVSAIGTKVEQLDGGRAGKREWTGEWQAAAQRTDDGYIVEARIPWAMLNYPSGTNRQMGINFVRYHRRLQLSSTWSFTTASDRLEDNGRWIGVSPPVNRGALRPQFLGYALFDRQVQSGKNELDVGLDVKWPVTPSFTALGAIHPDFKNVEQQVENIFFSRSEQFQSDSRPFFSDGSGFFGLSPDFSLGNLFYSRRIREFELGVKGYGQIGEKTKVGALATLGHHGEVNAVTNVEHALGQDFGIQGFAVDHRSEKENSSFAGGSVSRRFGNYWGELRGVRALEDGKTSGAWEVAGTYIVPGLLSDWRFMSIGPGFDPKLSLISERNRVGVQTYTELERNYRTGPLVEIEPSLFAYSFQRMDGGLHSRGVTPWFRMDFRNATRLGIGLAYNEYPGSIDRLIRVNYRIGTQTPRDNAGFFVSLGTVEDRPYQYWSASVNRRVLGKLDLSASAAIEKFRGTTRQVVGAAAYNFDDRRSIVGRMVQQNGNTNFYMMYRNAGFTGVETYVILGDPNSRTFERRLVLKVVVPF
ncbi:MAG: DUF5916 domain-containing protein [Fimbriimonadaceae bacterium]